MKWMLNTSGSRFGFIIVPEDTLLDESMLRRYLRTDIGTDQLVSVALMRCKSRSKAAGQLSVVSRFGNAHEVVKDTDNQGRARQAYRSDAYTGLLQSIGVPSNQVQNGRFALLHWDQTLDPVNEIPPVKAPDERVWQIKRSLPRRNTRPIDSRVTISNYKDQLVESGGMGQLLRLLAQLSREAKHCQINRVFAGSIDVTKLNGSCNQAGSRVPECGVEFFDYGLNFTLRDVTDWLLKTSASSFGRFGFIIVPDDSGTAVDVVRKHLLTDIGTTDIDTIQPVHIALIRCKRDKEASGKVSIVSRFGDAHTVRNGWRPETTALLEFKTDAFTGLRQSLDVDTDTWATDTSVHASFAERHFDKTVDPITDQPPQARQPQSPPPPSRPSTKARQPPQVEDAEDTIPDVGSIPSDVVNYYRDMVDSGKLQKLMDVMKGIANTNVSATYLSGTVKVDDIKGCVPGDIEFIDDHHPSTKCGISFFEFTGSSPEDGEIPKRLFDEVQTKEADTGFVITGLGEALAFENVARYVKIAMLLPANVHMFVIDPKTQGNLSVLSIHWSGTLVSRNVNTNSPSWNPKDFLESHTVPARS